MSCLVSLVHSLKPISRGCDHPSHRTRGCKHRHQKLAATRHPGSRFEHQNMSNMAANPMACAFDAIMNHPWAKQVQAGIQDLQRKHHNAFGAKLMRAPPKVIVPHRPAPFAAIIPGDSVGEAVLTTGLLNFLQLYNSALVIRLVLTWFPNPPAFIEQPLATVTDPYLGLFRGIIPPLGGTLDLSPILAFVCLNFFTSSAAALPCEVGAQPGARTRSNNPFSFLEPTNIQKAWNRRMQAQRAQKAAAADSTPQQ